MNREKQIEEMAQKLVDAFNDKRGKVSMKDLAEVLHTAGYHKQEWISVEDRLPEKSGTYLVHYHDDIIGEYVITREYWEKQRKFTPMEYFEEHTGRRAMHWMPLPEPPTEKEN